MNIYYSTNTSIRLSGSALKIIAVLSMVADHGAYYLMEHGTLLYEVMRCFGRIACPRVIEFAGVVKTVIVHGDDG